MVDRLSVDVIKQRSSTMPAVCGSSSLTQAPELPCLANLKIEPASGRVAWFADIPVNRWPILTDSGRSLPFKRLSSEL